MRASSVIGWILVVVIILLVLGVGNLYGLFGDRSESGENRFEANETFPALDQEPKEGLPRASTRANPQPLGVPAAAGFLARARPPSRGRLGSMPSLRLLAAALIVVVPPAAVSTPLPVVPAQAGGDATFVFEVEGVFEARGLALKPWSYLERGSSSVIGIANHDPFDSDNELLVHFGAPRDLPSKPFTPYVKVVHPFPLGTIGFERVRFRILDGVTEKPPDRFEGSLQFRLEDPELGTLRASVILNRTTLRGTGPFFELTLGDLQRLNYYRERDFGPQPAPILAETANGKAPNGSAVRDEGANWKLIQVEFHSAPAISPFPFVLDDVAVIASGHDRVLNGGFTGESVCTGTPGGVPYDPIVNGAFEAGLPFSLETDGIPGEAVALVGSALPGLTESNAKIVAPPWTGTVARGDRLPNSELRWLRNGGVNGTGALLILFDGRDSGPEALALAQAFAPPSTGGPVCGGQAVQFLVATNRPILVGTALFTDERPFDPHLAEVRRIEPGAFGAPELLRLEPASAAPTRVELLFSDAGGGVSHGAQIRLDDVQLLGATLL